MANRKQGFCFSNTLLSVCYLPYKGRRVMDLEKGMKVQKSKLFLNVYKKQPLSLP